MVVVGYALMLLRPIVPSGSGGLCQNVTQATTPPAFLSMHGVASLALTTCLGCRLGPLGRISLYCPVMLPRTSSRLELDLRGPTLRKMPPSPASSTSRGPAGVPVPVPSSTCPRTSCPAAMPRQRQKIPLTAGCEEVDPSREMDNSLELLVRESAAGLPAGAAPPSGLVPRPSTGPAFLPVSMLPLDAGPELAKPRMVSQGALKFRDGLSAGGSRPLDGGLSFFEERVVTPATRRDYQRLVDEFLAANPMDSLTSSFEELRTSQLEFFDSEYLAGKGRDAAAKVLSAMGFLRSSLWGLRSHVVPGVPRLPLPWPVLSGLCAVLVSTDCRLSALACFTAVVAYLRPGGLLWWNSGDVGRAQPASLRPSSTAAPRLFPEGRDRPSKTPRLLGRWAPEMPVRRYERSSRVASLPNRLSAALLVFCRLADWRLPDLVAGMAPVPPLPHVARRRRRT